MKKIQKLLIANRGEIASRVIRTCRKMGITSVAVFSEADRGAPYTEEADLALFIGESDPQSSYLNEDKIIEAAKSASVDAIHPGYGFLSENASFAKRCKDEHIVFVGPNAPAIEAMASKANAKNRLTQIGVPILPGYSGKEQVEQKLMEEAIKIGFPLLIKASLGGGGKGMRIVNSKDQLSDAIATAKVEVKDAFGDDTLILEKYISNARHIEFQIFGDQHENYIHLFERECTIQRRYQKVIEESPSPVLSNDLRKKMGEVAVNIAKALKYDNAGTVEFIFDADTQEFFFLEVNTRLQVEHPVTEAITGLDLVQMQIETAQGLPLSIDQQDVKQNGYAIEARLYAEDASQNFNPVIGTIYEFDVPKMDGVRVDTSIRSGSQISVFYDPMIAKIIVCDKNRDSAHHKMEYVLRHLRCQGITTNQKFLLKLVEHVDFRKGNYTTNFIDNSNVLSHIQLNDQYHMYEAAIATTLYNWRKRELQRTLLRHVPSGWRNNFYDAQTEKYTINNQVIELKYRFIKESFVIKINEQEIKASICSFKENVIRLEIDGKQKDYFISGDELQFYVQSVDFVSIKVNLLPRFPDQVKTIAKGTYEAPMPAQIIEVLVEKDQMIKMGDPLMVISSMKMKNTICAIENGILEEIFVEAGANVEAGTVLLKVNEDTL